MWVTYGPKWVWKRILISWMLLFACEGGVACACVCVCIHECVCLWMHRLPYVATLSRGACQGVLHQQLEEPNCVTGTGVGLSPSSHPVHNRTEPLCSNLVWWTTTSSSITPDQSHSFRGHCVRAYCKCSLRRRQQKKKKKAWKSSRITKQAPLYSFWATVQVFVFLIWVWFVAGAESDGKYWILPPRRGTCLVNPASPYHSPSLLALPSVTFGLLAPRCGALPTHYYFFSILCFCLCFTMSPPLSLPHPLTVWLSSSTPSSLPSLDSADELLLFHFPGISLCQAVWRQNT